MRDGDKRIVRLKEGEPRGRHVVIVDDLVQSGGTLIECQKLLTSQVGRRRCKCASMMLLASIMLLCCCGHPIKRASRMIKHSVIVVVQSKSSRVFRDRCRAQRT